MTKHTTRACMELGAEVADLILDVMQDEEARAGILKISGLEVDDFCGAAFALLAARKADRLGKARLLSLTPEMLAASITATIDQMRDYDPSPAATA